MSNEKTNYIEELFEGKEPTSKPDSVHFGEDVGRERIWSVPEEKYEELYPSKNKK